MFAPFDQVGIGFKRLAESAPPFKEATSAFGSSVSKRDAVARHPDGLMPSRLAIKLDGISDT